MLRDTQGPIGGYVDGARPEGATVRLSGWAIDVKARIPAKVIYVYLGDRVIGAGTPSMRRPEVTPGMVNQVAGFHVVTPRDVESPSTDRRLRIFSVNHDDRVYEVPIHGPLWPTIEELFKTKNPADSEAQALLAKAPSLKAMLKDTEGPVGGYVEGAQLVGGKVRLSGWAVDGKAKAPATAVYVYLGDRVIGAAAPSTWRPGMTPGMASQLARFQITTARDVDSQSTDRRFRVFSVNPNNRVYELIVHPTLWPTIEELFKTKRS